LEGARKAVRNCDTDVFTYADLLPVFRAIDKQMMFALEAADHHVWTEPQKRLAQIALLLVQAGRLSVRAPQLTGYYAEHILMDVEDWRRERSGESRFRSVSSGEENPQLSF